VNDIVVTTIRGVLNFAFTGKWDTKPEEAVSSPVRIREMEDMDVRIRGERGWMIS